MEITIEREPLTDGQVLSIILVPPEIPLRNDLNQRIELYSLPSALVSNEQHALISLRNLGTELLCFGPDFLSAFNDPTWQTGKRVFHCAFADN